MHLLVPVGVAEDTVLHSPQRWQVACWASALVHHQVPCVLGLVLQRVHRHVWIVWHCRSHQQGGAAE